MTGAKRRQRSNGALAREILKSVECLAEVLDFQLGWAWEDGSINGGQVSLNGRFQGGHFSGQGIGEAASIAPGRRRVGEKLKRTRLRPLWAGIIHERQAEYEAGKSDGGRA
jgi:hypothetical protein